MKKRLVSILLSAAMIATLATGCGGGSKSGTGTNSSSSPKATTASKDSSVPKYGGTLRYSSNFTVSTPGYTPELTNNAALLYLTTAYESLLYYDEKGNMIPKLATKWTTDPKEPSITWTLREGVKFADGTDFNAAAVKRNIEEYQKVKRNETQNIAKCEVIDDKTIKMVLKSWDSSTLEGIGFFVYYMSPKALENPKSLRESSCGTGAFQVKVFKSGISVKYEKNPNYWQKGKPYLDAVEVYMVDDPNTRSSAFQAGEYDIVLLNNLTVAQGLLNGPYIQEKNTSGIGLVGTGLIPNSANPNSPFANVKVRQAMCYAIDTEALVKAFGYGLLQTTNQWAAPGAITYNKNVKAYPYNEEKAKELLKEAGYPNGFDTVLTTNAGYKDIFTAAANMLTKVGIRCKINLVDDTAQTKLYSTGTWEGIMGHFHSISPDLGLYMGRHLDLNGAFYAKGIQHPEEAMKLLQEIRTAGTEEEKIKKEHEMQVLIYDKYALFGKPVYIQNNPIFKYDYVKDDRTGLDHVYTWSPQNAWLNK